MKKIALAVIATAFLAIGHAPVNAQQLPVECESGEFDGTEQECIDFYTETDERVGALPPTQSPTPTTTIAEQAGTLPTTGSGVSPILGIGALLFVGGGIVVVATRRRSAATAS